MKALILNSGIGKRMGEHTKFKPKCLVEIGKEETILSRQLRLLVKHGVTDVVITTGPFEELLVQYCNSLDLPLDFKFIHNPYYTETNYIYSIYQAMDVLKDSFILMHGDLVFEEAVLADLVICDNSCMTVSSKIVNSHKDFKAMIENGLITRISVDLPNGIAAAQPLYKITSSTWKFWMAQIQKYCEAGNVNCYAEDAFNDISTECEIYPLEIESKFCTEIDNEADLLKVREILKNIN